MTGPPDVQGDDPLAQVAEFKRQPIRFGCLGLSGTAWLVLIALALVAAYLLRGSR